MTTTAPRLLLPQLPPELRGEVYSYLSTPDTFSIHMDNLLPFKLKEYECKHTTVTITPLCYGSASLLALEPYHFLEAHEYRAWLRSNSVQLHIKLVFKGRIQTFVQADWTRRLETHLHKLVKQHAWLRKVAHYNIQIDWAASDGIIRGKKQTPTGRIPRAMVSTLLLLMEEKVKTNSAFVKVKLRLEHRIAIEHIVAGTSFGLGVFLATPLDHYHKVKDFIVEAWKTPALVRPGPGARGERVKAAPSCAPDHLLLRKSFGHDDELPTVVWGDAQHRVGAAPDFILGQLRLDCAS
ncbi:hypothetical protein J1614_007801 [Plenodomus biglobosus]|nr:hypothetical protein J1614_007801 [Plenodomus biglobosus]